MKKVLYKIIRFYKKRVSSGLRTSCIFRPSCSEYAMTAIKEYGGAKATAFSVYRILRCNHFSLGGYDPVPLNVKKYKWSL